jgi:hypothetical protein
VRPTRAPYVPPAYVGGPGTSSVGKLTTAEALEDIGGIDPGEVADQGKDHNPGRGIYRRQLEAFTTLKDEAQITLLRDTWKEIAMGAATRAKAFVATCSSKDFGTLQRLIAAGTASMDQAFPPQQSALSTNLIINMFGSLGQRAASIAAPAIPTIDVTPTEVPCPSSSSSQESPN